MKLIMEVDRFETGKSTEGRKWTRLFGRDSRGAYASARFFAGLAESLNKELARFVPHGSEIGSSRVVVELTGEWQTREYKKPDGTPARTRSFYAATFDILTGPVLELARLRRDAAERVALAEQHRQAGRLDLAYRTAVEFAATVSGRPLDLADLEAVIAEDDEAEFGVPSGHADDPEAAAAARYASMDGASEPMTLARQDEASHGVPATIDPEPEPAAEEHDVLDDIAIEAASDSDPEPDQQEAVKQLPAAAAPASRPASAAPSPSATRAAAPVKTPPAAPAPVRAPAPFRPIPPRPPVPGRSM